MGDAPLAHLRGDGEDAARKVLLPQPCRRMHQLVRHPRSNVTFHSTPAQPKSTQPPIRPHVWRQCQPGCSVERLTYASPDIQASRELGHSERSYVQGGQGEDAGAVRCEVSELAQVDNIVDRERGLHQIPFEASEATAP